MTVAEQAVRHFQLPSQRALQAPVETRVRQRLAECSYSYYLRDVTVDFGSGVLTLRGRVPTFYMKQIAQSLLGDIDGVSGINNRLDVVSASGLSSVRPK